MANEADRHRRAVRAQLAALPRIQADTLKEILRQLREAQTRIATALAQVSTEFNAARLQTLRREIDSAMAVFQQASTAAVDAAALSAWEAGIALTEAPLVAAGVEITGLRVAVNRQALIAMQSFLTDRIADISLQTTNRLNAALGQMLLGTRNMTQTVDDVARILGGAPRGRAITIVRTEIGRAYSVASQESQARASAVLPGLKKRWLKSGKLHPRPEHVAAHNQVVGVNEPFIVGGEALMYPRDPAGSAANTINCGCLSVPVTDGSSFGASRVNLDVRTAGARLTKTPQRDLGPTDTLGADPRFDLPTASDYGLAGLNPSTVESLLDDLDGNG